MLIPKRQSVVSATEDTQQPNQDEVTAYDESEELGKNQDHDACGERNNRRKRRESQRQGAASHLRECRGAQ